MAAVSDLGEAHRVNRNSVNSVRVPRILLRGDSTRSEIFAKGQETHTMEKTEKRNSGRVGTCNLISFVAIDDQGHQIGHGMGKAIDISQRGLRLHTTHPVPAERVSLMATGHNGQLIEIMGLVVYSRRSEEGGYHWGIELNGSQEERVRFATSLIKAFHYGKRKGPSGGMEAAAVSGLSRG